MAEPISGKLAGLKTRKLIRELALGELNQARLAEQYDVTPSAISVFAKRYRDQIEAVRKDADDEFAGLLIVQKAHRLGVLEQLLEQALTPTPKIAPSGRLVEDHDGNVIKEIAGELAAKVLKQAAEETGQLPNRVSLSGNVNVITSYAVEGVDPADLA